MTKRTRATFNPEFKLEVALLVTEQGYSVREAADAMGVGKSTMDKWVCQLRQEQNGITPKATPITPEQFSIIKKLKQSYSITTLCKVFSVNRSSYKYRKARSTLLSVELIKLKS